MDDRSDASVANRVFIYGALEEGDDSFERVLSVLLRCGIGSAHATVAAPGGYSVPRDSAVDSLDLRDLQSVEACLRECRLAFWLSVRVPAPASAGIGWMADVLTGRAAPDLIATHLALLRGTPVCALDLVVDCSPDGIRAQPGWVEALHGVGLIAARDRASCATLRDVLGSDALIVQADLQNAPRYYEQLDGPSEVPSGTHQGNDLDQAASLLADLSVLLSEGDDSDRPQQERLRARLTTDCQRVRLRRALRPAEAYLRLAEVRAQTAAWVAVAEARVRAAEAIAPAADARARQLELRVTEQQAELDHLRWEHQAVLNSTAWKVGSALTGRLARLARRRTGGS